jgi:hypothetical protein
LYLVLVLHRIVFVLDLDLRRFLLAGHSGYAMPWHVDVWGDPYLSWINGGMSLAVILVLCFCLFFVLFVNPPLSPISHE